MTTNDQPTTVPSPTHTDPGDIPLSVIIYMSGRRRGTNTQLSEQTHFIRSPAVNEVEIVAPGESPDDDPPAKLHHSGLTYELDVSPGHEVWVNGKKVSQKVLASGDVLEIGRNGPMLRFRLYTLGTAPCRSTADAFADCIDCVRYYDETFVKRSSRFIGSVSREFLIRSPLWFRIGVLSALTLLFLSVILLTYQSWNLRTRLAQEEARTQGISGVLEHAQQRAITEKDLAAVRTEIEIHLLTTADRLTALEARSAATTRIISTASKSTVFLQGSYDFVEKDTGQPLRYVSSDPNGQPRVTEQGPEISLDGNGPVVEFQYTGTAFVATEDGLLLTARHVALPWEESDVLRFTSEMNLKPVSRRLIGYLPGIKQSFAVKLLHVSDEADIAILQGDKISGQASHLSMSSMPARPGDEIIIIAYPTGIRAMLARTDERFLKKIRESGDLNFWNVVEKLSNEGRITPLATRGIVGQVTPEAVVYDAETTRGASGGAVLNINGEVIAVNAAVLPEFGGSNLGVPIARALPLLKR